MNFIKIQYIYYSKGGVLLQKYSEETINAVIEANDIIDIVSDYVELKKTGNSYKGKCPFHNEKTASFMVSAEKQLYHCFGCGVGGNVIGFVMAIENFQFLEALQFLAKRANIQLPDQQHSTEEDLRYKEKERFYEMHRELANYYYRCLMKTPQALKYLSDRGLTAKTIKQYGLGYSPNHWDFALKYLREKNFTEAEILKAGLISKNDRGNIYDRFRNRIMFPIVNVRNQVIAFGGRQFLEDHGPKYLNSPETPIFSKSYELFNLNLAKRQSTQRKILLVEGYMDVISLYQQGVFYACAALGTAFTSYHAKLLKRYADEVVLCFDGDVAGQNATLKAINILKDTALDVRVLTLPLEDDPDSYIRKYGKDQFEEQVNNAKAVIDYLLDQKKTQYQLEHSNDKIKYVNEGIQILRALRDPVQIDYYTNRISKETGISKKIIGNQIGDQTKAPLVVPKNETTTIPKSFEMAQSTVLNMAVRKIDFLTKQGLDETYFSAGIYQKIAQIILDHPGIKEAEIISEFTEAQEIAKVTKVLILKYDESDLKNALMMIKEYQIKKEIRRLEKAIQKESDPNNAAMLAMKMAAIKKKTTKENL